MDRLISCLVLLGCGACSSNGFDSGTPSASDKTPFGILETDPPDGTSDVQRSLRLVLRFTDEADPDSIQLSSKPKSAFTFKFSQASGREFDYDTGELLARDTEYRFTIEASAKSGDALASPYQFSFTTGSEPRTEAEQAPTVYLMPRDSATGVELEPTLSFSFSKPMDEASVASSLHFEPAVAGKPAWKDDDTGFDYLVTKPLVPATSYAVSIDVGAAAQDGSALEQAFVSRFTTKQRPRLVSSSPEDGGVLPDTSGTVRLTFEKSNFMDADSLKTAFSFESPAGHAVKDATCFFETCTLSTDTPFMEKEAVSWKLTTDATDENGIALAEPVSGSFEIGQRVSVDLAADAALDGSVTEGGVVDASGLRLDVGRNGTTPVRALLSFDLSQLPADMLALSKATLRLNHEATSGTPNDLGLLLAYSVAYGAKLDKSGFDTPVFSYETCGLLPPCSSQAYDAGLSASAGALWTAPVTQLVARDLEAKAMRSQMRVAFKGDLSSSSDGTETFSSANATAAKRPVLQVEYWKP